MPVTPHMVYSRVSFLLRHPEGEVDYDAESLSDEEYEHEEKEGKEGGNQHQPTANLPTNIRGVYIHRQHQNWDCHSPDQSSMSDTRDKGDSLNTNGGVAATCTAATSITMSQLPPPISTQPPTPWLISGEEKKTN